MPKKNQWGPRPPSPSRQAFAARPRPISPEIDPQSPDNPFAGALDFLESHFRMVPSGQAVICTCRVCGWGIIGARRSDDLEGSTYDLARLMRHAIDGHVLPGQPVEPSAMQLGNVRAIRHFREGVMA